MAKQMHLLGHPSSSPLLLPRSKADTEAANLPHPPTQPKLCPMHPEANPNPKGKSFPCHTSEPAAARSPCSLMQVHLRQEKNLAHSLLQVHCWAADARPVLQATAPPPAAAAAAARAEAKDLWSVLVSAASEGWPYSARPLVADPSHPSVRLAECQQTCTQLQMLFASSRVATRVFVSHACVRHMLDTIW